MSDLMRRPFDYSDQAKFTYVSHSSGNDATGDGSIFQPFATLQYALNLINDDEHRVIIVDDTEPSSAENITLPDTSEYRSASIICHSAGTSWYFNIGTLTLGNNWSLFLNSVAVSTLAETVGCTWAELYLEDVKLLTDGTGAINIPDTELHVYGGHIPAVSWNGRIVSASKGYFFDGTKFWSTGGMFANGKIENLQAYSADFNYVSWDRGSDTTGDGSITNPYKTVQEAIDNASDEDIIITDNTQTSAATVTIPANTKLYLVGVPGPVPSTSGINFILNDQSRMCTDNILVNNVTESTVAWALFIMEEGYLNTCNAPNTQFNLYNTRTTDAGLTALRTQTYRLLGNVINKDTYQTVVLGGLNANSKRITNVLDPTSPQHADTQAARDAAIVVHAGVAAAHHAKYTDGEADARVSAGIATHVGEADPHTQYQKESEKDAANGYAGLGADTKINSAQLPAIAITDTFPAANETEQLALTVQKGDVCVRTDENKSYINKTGNNTSMADWELLLTPTDAVLSVDARVGAVTLSDLYEPKDATIMKEGENNSLLTNDSDYQSGTQVDGKITTHKGDAAAHHARPIQATESIVGIAEIATQAEADAGADDTRMVTPTKLANYPFPDPTKLRRYNFSTRMRVGSGAGAASSGQIQDVPCILFETNKVQEAFTSNEVIPEVDLSSVNPKLRFHWLVNIAPTVGKETVRFQLELRYRADGETWDGAYDETLTQDIELPTGSAYVRGHTDFALDRTKLASNDGISVVVTRVGTHGNDDYDSDFAVSQIWFVYSGTGGE